MAQCIIKHEAGDLFVILGGVKIAKRGQPKTPQAGQWVSLEPGYVVLDSADRESIVVEYNGAVLQ